MEKAIEFQKNIYSCFLDYAKAFDSGSQWTVEILKEMGIPGYLTCLLRNLYADQEATLRTGHRTTDWFQIGKGVCQGCIWRRQWQPTPVLLPGKSHGRRSLVGCNPWGHYKSDTIEQLHFHTMEEEMATHSSVLAWRIPGMGEPGRLPSMELHRVRHDWSDLAAAAVRLYIVTLII